MSMGQRIQQELDLQGLSMTALCAQVSGLKIGTLSALIARNSERSKFAPIIARVLKLNLNWLLTGEGEKYYEAVESKPIDSLFVESHQAGNSTKPAANVLVADDTGNFAKLLMNFISLKSSFDALKVEVAHLPEAQRQNFVQVAKGMSREAEAMQLIQLILGEAVR